MQSFIKKNQYKNSIFSILFSIFFVVLIVVPIQFLNNNINEIPKVIDGQILLIYLTNVIIFFLIFYFLCKKLAPNLNNNFLIYFLTFILFWIILNGIMFPSIGGSTDFWKQYISPFRLRYVLLLKLIVTLVFVYIIFKITILRYNFIRFLNYYLIITLLLNLFFVTFNFLIPNHNDKFDITKFNIGSNNLLIISFDGINGNVISDLIRNEKNINLFKDFNLYSNYIVTFPTTKYSISSELTHSSDLEKIKNNDLIINQNDNNLHNIYTYGAYNEIFNGRNKLYEGIYYNDNNYFKLQTFLHVVLFPSISRWATFKFYNIYNIKIRHSDLYKSILKILSFDFFFDDSKLFNDYYRNNINEVLKIFNKKNYTNLDTNNAYFFHFNFSHWYILFDEKCNYVPLFDSQSVSNKLQNYEGNIKNSKCVLNKIKSIIKSFQDNNIYNENTIVFKSDHGKPKGFHESNFFNESINENERWSVGRYNSFFMIKEKNKFNEGINIINDSVGSKFLYDFYCDNFPISVNCENKITDNIYIPINKNAFLDLKDFKKIQLNQFTSLNF